MTLNIATPDNAADITVTLQISGNRLVSICNALQSLMYRHDYIGPNSEGWQHYADVNEIVERVRDELSAQRIAAR